VSDTWDRRRPTDHGQQIVTDGRKQQRLGGICGVVIGVLIVNEVNVALVDLDFTEFARNQTRQIGGMAASGDIEVRSRHLAVSILALGSGEATHRAAMGLRADEQFRGDLDRGRRGLGSRDGVLFVATGRGTVVDDALLDEVIRVVDRIPRTARAILGSTPPPTGPAPGPAPVATLRAVNPTAGFSAGDPIEQLGRLSALHRDGSLDDAEFQDKKASLLKRI
jgi:hypothetical protein